MAIQQLARKVVSGVSSNKLNNIKALQNMPEMVLNKAIRSGAKDIVHVDMNHCGAALIRKGGVHTIYTDSLAGCDALGVIAKTKEGTPFAMVSHYVPTNTKGHLEAIEKQLEIYAPYCDKNYQPKVFFNVRGVNVENELKTLPNTFIEKAKAVLKRFFPQGIDSSVTPYPTAGRGAFFSSVNAYQFDPNDLNKMRVTFVGEVEKNIDLMM